MAKASDNPFPSILITEGTEPAAPAAGKQRLYIDSTTHHLKRTDSSGTDVDIEAGGGGGDSAWTDVSAFTNSWIADTDTTYSSPGYFKDASGFVHLRGRVKNGTVGTSAFTLPAGYRPGKKVQSSPTGRFEVQTSGTVLVLLSGTSDLNGIPPFWAEA